MRTLGLPASSERALMAVAYENYVTAQTLHQRAHNSWRRAQRAHGDDSPVTKGALTKAGKAALYLTDAKAQYRQAKKLAFEAAA